MRITTFLLTILVGALAGAGRAQHHATGWIFTGRPMHGPGPLVTAIDPTGSRAVTLLAGNPSQLVAHDAIMDLDNRTYVVSVQRWGEPSHLLKIDAAGVAVGTLAALRDAYGSSPGGRLFGLTPDPDGGYYAIFGPGVMGGDAGLARCDRATGRITTIRTGPPFFDPVALTTDLETGDLIVLDRSRRLYRVDPAIGSVSTFAVLPYDAGFGLARLAATGEFFVPAQCPPNTIGTGPVFRIAPGGRVQIVPHPSFVCSEGVCVDRASARIPRLTVAASGATPGQICSGIISIDPANSATILIDCRPFYHYRTVRPNQGRHLAVRRITTRVREIRVSFPGEGHSHYTLALSLSGTLPGLPLPDRRHIALNPDALTFLSVTGQLGPHLRGAAGRLDAYGEARAILDASAFPGLAGRPVWAIAVSHDPQASFRIHTIPDPVLLIL